MECSLSEGLPFPMEELILYLILYLSTLMILQMKPVQLMRKLTLSSLMAITWSETTSPVTQISPSETDYCTSIHKNAKN